MKNILLRRRLIMSITVSENPNGGNSKNVKDMLRAGASPDELLSRLQEEINSAQEELEAEATLKHNHTEEDIDELRSILVEDALEYLEALGVLKAIPDFDYDEEKDYDLLYEVLCGALENAEPQLQIYAALVAPWLKMAVDFDKTDKDCNCETCHCEDNNSKESPIKLAMRQVGDMSDAATRLKDIMHKYDL